MFVFVSVTKLFSSEPSLLAFNTLTNPENEWGVKLTQIAQWTAFYENQFKLKAH